MNSKIRSSWPQSVVLAAGLLSVCLLVAILYLARPVLIPIALAVLLAFLAVPLVERLERSGLKRVPAVLVTLAGAALLVIGLLWFVGLQLNLLLTELPRYHENLRSKITALQAPGRDGSVSKMLATVEELAGQRTSGTPAGRMSPRSGPVQVQVVKGDRSWLLARALDSLGALAPVVAVAANGVFALVLAVFILIRREELRNRLVSFASRGWLATTTKAVNDAENRISRYLRVQLVLNSAFGAIIALGLLALRVPYAFLWGAVAAILRYVPYLGTWIAALLPLAVSFIVFPSYRECALVLGLFVVLDIVTANAVEPRLYGQGIGVSEVALLASAAFWAWIWGPVGLILAAPLTVCVVVAGKYVPSLGFLDRLLGDAQALPPHAAFLQRLLARDEREASSIVERFVEESPPEAVYDGLLLEALSHARLDRAEERMSARDEAYVVEETRAIVRDLGPELPDDLAAQRVLGCPARHEVEELTLTMLDQLLRPQGVQVEVLSTRTLPSDIADRVMRERPRVVVVATMPPDGLPQTEYLCRTLRRSFPELDVVVGYWGYKQELDEIIQRLRQAGASAVTTTLLGARGHVLSLLQQPLPAVAQDTVG